MIQIRTFHLSFVQFIATNNYFYRKKIIQTVDYSPSFLHYAFFRQHIIAFTMFTESSFAQMTDHKYYFIDDKSSNELWFSPTFEYKYRSTNFITTDRQLENELNDIPTGVTFEIRSYKKFNYFFFLFFLLPGLNVYFV